MSDYFAIRRRVDGAFIPAVCGKRGSTQAEPSTTAPPRLFMRAADARSALRFWAEGVWRLIRSGRQNPYSGEYDYDEEFAVDRVDGRRVEDFDVVRVHLVAQSVSR